VERPNDIAFLSRPESTGENGTRIYGAVGLEGYDNGRVAHSTSREHEDFSRKIHMFEEQMKQESFHSSPSHSGHFKSLGHSHRDDVTSSRISPAKEAAKERISPVKQNHKERPVEEESVAPQEIASPAHSNVAPEAEEPSSSTVEVPSVALKEDLPSVSAEEPAIAEAVVEEKDIGETPDELPTVNDAPDVSSRELPVEEEHSQEADNHVEVSGEQGVEDEIQPKEPSVEVVEKEAETTHSTEPVEELVAGEPVSGKEEESTIPAEVSESTSEEAPVENGKHEEQSKSVPQPKVPLIRKQFQRSDSLLAVFEHEHDSQARAAEWAGEPAISEKPSTPEPKESEGSEEKEQAPCEPAIPVNSDKIVETHNANDLRVLGNLCFGEENYHGAAELYTRSLHLAEDEETRQGKPVCSREIILGYSNRAEAYIRLQEFDKALADAKKALARDPSHLKSLFRKGRALLGLSQYEQALTTLQAAAPRAPSDRDLQAALHESSTAVQQSCHGHYDLSQYYLKGKQTGESPHCADYIGPVIITDVGRGRGRGLVLTKDVEAGELLLVSNPIAFLPLQNADQSRNDISQAFVNGKVQEGFRKIVEASHSHNKGLERLPSLYDGEKALPAPSVQQTHFESASHLDGAQIRRIIQLNAINGDATMGWKNLPGSGEQAQKVRIAITLRLCAQFLEVLLISDFFFVLLRVSSYMRRLLDLFAGGALGVMVVAVIYQSLVSSELVANLGGEGSVCVRVPGLACWR
jgi:tetratricopeptide (TPR) repeat protein